MNDPDYGPPNPVWEGNDPQPIRDRSEESPSKQYREFPLSIRVAQRSWLVAIIIPIFLRQMLRAKVPWMSIAVLMASGLCACVGLVATYISVIRYPYMGLVDAADGDLYAKYVESRSKFLFTLVKIVGLLAGALALVLPFLDGQLNGKELLFLLYVVPVVGFIGFLVFRYDRMEHPTVATLLRCSMGLGVPLFPLFIPALLIGSMRAKALLDQATTQIESEERYS